MVHDEFTQPGPATNEDRHAAEAAKKRQRGAGRLAAALGVDRRTLYKLQLRGAPAAFTEPEWREWLRMCRPRMQVRPPLELRADVPRGPDDDAELDAADADQVVEISTRSPAAAGAEGKGADAAPASEKESPGIAKLTAETEVRNLQARKLRLEIDEQERRLVPRDQVATALEALAAEIVSELVDLPAASVRETQRTLPDMPDAWRKPIRRCIEQAVGELRDRVAKALRERLRSALARKGGTHG